MSEGINQEIIVSPRYLPQSQGTYRACDAFIHLLALRAAKFSSDKDKAFETKKENEESLSAAKKKRLPIKKEK